MEGLFKDKLNSCIFLGISAEDTEEEIFGFCYHLIEANEHVDLMGTETVSLEKQITELDATCTVTKKTKEDLETYIKPILSTLEEEVPLLGTKMADLKTIRNEKDKDKLRLVNIQYRVSTTLMRTLFNLTLTTQAVTMEKESLKIDLDKATRNLKPTATPGPTP
ncbi:hypothetical protein B9Z19DRAFT_1137948 [Tuber borchii]|uniref:Uncharacterized protein n=1 Tax=Tuber borchii TaxID=42251 RepID=A0A2T6ZA19_TUBBO|nr:hypothetical protein B9Z19DRAFT_1137948 [Tuber borchii]